MRRIIPFILGLVMSVTMMAQSTGKQTLQARMLTTRQPSSKVKTFGANGNTVEVVLKLDDATAETTIEQLKAAGITLHSRLGQQVSATMPQSAIHAVEQLPGVVRIATHTTLMVNRDLLVNSRIQVRVLPLSSSTVVSTSNILRSTMSKGIAVSKAYTCLMTKMEWEWKLME